VTKIFGALAAILLALVVFAPPAEAHCWWNGYRWHCSYYRHYVRHWYPYRYYGYYPYPYYYRPYYRPYYAYACIFPFCW
jgi:hypothetical protein